MKLLMCPPLYYRHRSEERERALSEWRGLYRLLRDELQVEVDLLEPRPDLPALAHVGSGGFVAGDTFIASCNPDSTRETESEPLENFFLVRGYDIKHLDSEVRFEGTRDLTTCNGTLFTGFHSEDLQYRAQEEIGAILGSEVVGLELAAHWQRPLANCLCPVGDEEAIFCPTAFTDTAREQLRSRISKLVPVDESEGGPGICESLIVGSDLIVAEGCTTVPSTLEDLGLIVHELPLNEFSEAGGPRTLALQLE
jgi:N-dimethylarginine dimethylaminohydrolase